jgi:two-component system chemotaxis response regulator CheB
LVSSADILRVVVADDSAICRQALKDALEADPEIQVVAEARDGQEAVALVQQHRPSLVTMDLRMPKLNGLEAIEQIMRRHPTPILVVTDQPRLDGVDTTFAALSRGALDLLPKATAWTSGESRALVTRVKQLARAASEVRPAAPPAADLKPVKGPAQPVEVVGIGASTGGPKALRELVVALPPRFELPMVLVQHMNAQFHDGFVQWLGRYSQVPVRPASEGARLERGVMFVAPQGTDLVIESGGVMRLRSPSAGAMHCPSVDRLFNSLAETYGRAGAGVLLTGMGSDGAKGLKAINDRGGVTVAQDRQSSVIHGMPGAAIALGAAQWVLSIAQIAMLLSECSGKAAARPAPARAPQRKKILLVDDSAVVLEATKEVLEEAGYEVIASDNPIALPALVRRERPDLALVDVKMPAVGGDAVARIIGQGNAPTQVVLYSDLGNEELKKLAKECGAKGYLKKSTDTELLNAVRGFLKSGSTA